MNASEFDSDPSALSVVIIYEDFETGKNAKSTYDYLTETLGKNIQFTNNMWKMDVLTIPKIREIAAKDAAMADIVIVSCHGNVELPVYVKQWADHWLSLNGKSVALVGLVDNRQPHTENIRSYLRFLADRAHLEFFSHPDKPMPVRTAPPQEAIPAVPKRSAKTMNTLAGAVEREVYIPRWGINE